MEIITIYTGLYSASHSQMLDTLKVNNGLGIGVAYGYSFSRFHENIYIEYAVPLRHIERANAVVIAA